MSLIRKLLKPFMIVLPHVFRNSETVAYPTERPIFPERYRGRHLLYFDKCISCNTCARVCPCNSIELVDVEGREGKYPQIDYQTCSLCGYCVEFCPKNALDFTEFVEFSEYDRSNLVEEDRDLPHGDCNEIQEGEGRMIEHILFLAITVASAYYAISSKNIVYGVVALLCTNVSLGVVYYMMGAPTVALFQLAIFAGAIVVFFVITVMFTKAGSMSLADEEVEQ
jgi:NADH-quinone oxidoreductase chain I